MKMNYGRANMEIKIIGTPEEVKKLLANTGDKELVTKDELDSILSEYVKFANPIKKDDLYAAYSKEATK